MAHRDVGVSICGVVVGVMLGAGSILYAQDSVLSGTSSDLAYRGQDTEGAEEFRARNIERIQREDSEAAARAARRARSSETHEAAPFVAPVEMSECDVTADIITRMALARSFIIPNDQRYSELNNQLAAVEAQIYEDYCGSGEAPEEMEETKSAAPRVIDNNCEQCRGSQLRECEGSQEKNQVYVCRP